MTCKLTLDLVSETQEGNIGDTWMYDLDAKVFCGGLQSEATVNVPKHTLRPGDVQEPFGSPESITLYVGECGDEVLLRFELTATEVDMFVNDRGKTSKDVKLEMPGPGCAGMSREFDIAVGVRESPGITPKNAIFTLRVRLTMESTA